MKETQDGAGGEGMGRTGLTHRSRDIHFHFIFLARYQSLKERKRKTRKKRKKKEKQHFGVGGVGKNFGHSPENAPIASLSGSREANRARVGIHNIHDFTSVLMKKYE